MRSNGFLFFLFYGSCDFVELTVRTGQLARLSGSRNGFNITVRGDRSRVLNIRFTTDGSITGLGFLARYVIIFGEQTINSWRNYTMTIYIYIKPFVRVRVDPLIVHSYQEKRIT